MSSLTNLTDEAVWEDENDDYYEEDFSEYVPTAFQPGWDFTYIVILICIGINALLPFMLCLANRRKRAKDPIVMETHALVPSDFGREMQDESRLNKSMDDDDKSLGGMSIASNAISVVSSVFDQRVNKGIYHRQQPRKRRGRRVIKPRDVNANDDVKSLGSRSFDANSVMGTHAVDAKQINVNKMGAVVDDPDRELSTSERLVDCSTWDEEMKKIVSLWAPYSISGAAEGFAEIVSFAIISHYIGLREANAYVTVIILIETTEVFLYGFIEAVGVLGPQADGACNDLLVGRYMQLGLIFYTLLCIPSIIIWSLYTEPVVRWFGFDEETAQLAQAYAYPMLASGIFEGAGEVLDSFLEFMDHEKFAMTMTLLGEVVEVGIFIVMASMGTKDLVLIGIIQALASFLMMISIISVVLYWGWLDDYWEGIALTWGWDDKRAVNNMVKTAIPLGISYLLTYGEWEVMTIFAAHMGPAEVAAWGVLGFVWDTFEYVVDGLADAVEVRVAFRMGAGEMTLAKSSAYKGMYLAIVSSVYGTAGLFLMSGHLPGWITPDPTIQHMIFETLPLIGFGQILMSVGMVCWNIIGAQGPERLRLATIIEFISSWILVVPMASVMIYGYNFNLMGLVGPLVLGYTVGCVAIIFILFTSDWAKLSDNIVEQNGGNITYDEYDWRDLPLKIQESAILLGYTDEMWDNDEEPTSSCKDWKELTTDEQGAAHRLGFNRRKWDNDGSGGTEEELRSTSTGYDDYDWEELPFMIQQAARVLGYTSNMWDADKEPASSKKGWTELNLEEQEAAIKLGYDERKWDGNNAFVSPAKIAYDDMDWTELPSDIQNAAKVLGYTKAMWDSDREPKTVEKNWKKLTVDENIAAEKLGYNENSWDGNGKSTSHSQNKSAAKAISDAATGYDDLDWDKLPSNIQESAKVLGYTGRRWDTDDEPLVFYSHWKDLTPEMKTAAKEIGYSQAKWDIDAEKKGPINYFEYKWSKQPPEVQNAATVIGYTPKMWNNKNDPELRLKSWRELSPEQRSAAEVIGFNETKWSKAPLPNYDEYSWKKLPAEVQEAAMVLGYTAKMWNNDQDPKLCEESDYDDLTSEQKAVALVLGYDKKKWDSD